MKRNDLTSYQTRSIMFSMFTLFLILFGLLTTSIADSTWYPPIVGYISTDDRVKMKSLFLDNLDNTNENSREQKLHSYLGLKSLGHTTDQSKICNLIGDPVKNAQDALLTYIGSSLSEEKCKIDTEGLEKLYKNLDNGINGEDLFKIVMASKVAGISVDSSKIKTLVKASLTRASGPLDMGYSLLLLSKFGFPKSDLEEFESYASELLEYAIEIPGLGLFYERGTFTTALIANALFELSSALNRPLSVAEDKLIKLINFLFYNRHTRNLRAASHIMTAFRAIKSNPVYLTVVLENAQPGSRPGRSTTLPYLANIFVDPSSSSESIQLRVTDLFASQKPFKGLTLNLDTLVNNSSQPLDKHQRAFEMNSESVYQASLKSSDGKLPVPGVYEAQLSAKMSKSPKVLLGASNVRIPLSVKTQVKVSHASFALIDKEHYQQDENKTLTPGKKHASALQIDSNHQLSFAIKLVDAIQNHAIAAHQVFLRLTHASTKRMINFVFANPSSSSADMYTLRLLTKTHAADFDYLSGLYQAHLVVGDPLIVNPMNWHMLDLELDFSYHRHGKHVAGDESRRRDAAINKDVSKQRISSVAGQRFLSGSALIGSGPRSKLPDIEHVFRPAEKRAPVFLALLFTAFCLAPLPIMLIAWLILGINMSYFRFSLSAIAFHLGLVAIFALYFAYWFWLDMFTTLRYLALIGLPTLLFGSITLRARLSLRVKG